MGILPFSSINIIILSIPSKILSIHTTSLGGPIGLTVLESIDSGKHIFRIVNRNKDRITGIAIGNSHYCQVESISDLECGSLEMGSGRTI
jgi:hypothetical protein